MTRDAVTKRPGAHLPLVLLLIAVVMLIPLGRPLFFLSTDVRLITGYIASLLFLLLLFRESRPRQLAYLALAAPLTLLALSPISTDLSAGHMVQLGIIFVAVLFMAPLILQQPGSITFRVWPDRLDAVDIAYTLLSIPLAWAGFALYFGLLSPEVPFNWQQPADPDTTELFKLFMGINAVGVWDELFFINSCYAVLRLLFGFRTANLAQAVIYTSVLYQMAFSGWGPVFIYTLALTQGIMYERSKVLLWVLLVHLIVDYFLFQAIVERYYPGLHVWWHL